MLRAVPILPQTFRADMPDLLRTDLDRLSEGLREWIRRAAQRLLTIPELARSEVIVTGTVSVGFDEIIRVGPRLNTDTVKVTLPRNGPQHTGKTLHVIKTTATGKVVLWSTGCSINSGTNLILLYSPMLTTVMSDGQNFYASNAGAGAA